MSSQPKKGPQGIRAYLYRFIPPKARFVFMDAIHFFHKFKQVHYSQNGEDIILQKLFPKSHKGFYVDIGAHHPYRLSNTYLLYKQGWSGLNIDANPDTIKMFNRARKRDINVCAAIGEKVGTMSYHQFTDPAVNTLSVENAADWKQNKTWNEYLGATKVDTIPLGILLAEQIPNRQIDVLSIDIEGFDLIALQTNDWGAYSPTVILIEDHGFQLHQPEHSLVYQYLTEKHYVLTNKTKFTLIFEKRLN